MLILASDVPLHHTTLPLVLLPLSVPFSDKNSNSFTRLYLYVYSALAMKKGRYRISETCLPSCDLQGYASIYVNEAK